MKNIFKLLFASLFVVNFSCHDSENVIDGVLDYETGAILRTISVDNAVLNLVTLTVHLLLLLRSKMRLMEHYYQRLE